MQTYVFLSIWERHKVMLLYESDQTTERWSAVTCILLQNSSAMSKPAFSCHGHGMRLSSWWRCRHKEGALLLFSRFVHTWIWCLCFYDKCSPQSGVRGLKGLSLALIPFLSCWLSSFLPLLTHNMTSFPTQWHGSRQLLIYKVPVNMLNNLEHCLYCRDRICSQDSHQVRSMIAAERSLDLRSNA